MAAYTGIQGQNILIVSSDPSNPTEGQIWYNTTTNLLKGYANVATNAWAAGGNMNTARTATGAINATQTAALAFAGYTGSDNTAATEKYNGTSWTSVNSMNTARRGVGGSGIQTAALAFGGFSTADSAATESYNGTSWTSVNSLNSARPGVSGAGLQTATIASGGYTGGSPLVTTSSESWNGTSWTSTSSMNTGRYNTTFFGIQTAAITLGGGDGGAVLVNAIESWNGSSWTTLPATYSSPNVSASRGAGTQTAAVVFGGYTPSSPSGTGATFLWNGTSLSSNPNSMATARSNGGAAGTQSAALMFGGNDGTNPVTATEEWTGTALATRTITSS